MQKFKKKYTVPEGHFQGQSRDEKVTTFKVHPIAKQLCMLCAVIIEELSGRSTKVHKPFKCQGTCHSLNNSRVANPWHTMVLCTLVLLPLSSSSITFTYPEEKAV